MRIFLSGQDRIRRKRSGVLPEWGWTRKTNFYRFIRRASCYGWGMTVIFDADDTLWHNMNVFSDTHAQFAAVLKPYFADAERLQDELEATEYRNIQHFGYGVKGFTLSMVETAIDVTEGRIDAASIREILEMGKAMLSAPVDLLPGVAETVQTLAERYPVGVITKGDLFNQETKIARSGLAELFQFVEVVSEKNPETYAKLFDRHQLEAANVTMVGNSLKSDVLPVLRLGGRAVHIPYELTWVHEEAELPEEFSSLDRFRALGSISDLPQLLASW
jgi:Predicted hydrolase (HAD superfamily)